MESKYDASWRKSSKASQHFCRRKWIWIAIETLIVEGVTEEKAVRETDNGMKEMKKSLKQAPVMFGKED
jgi:Transcriptional activator of glycolytic enzymes